MTGSTIRRLCPSIGDAEPPLPRLDPELLTTAVSTVQGSVECASRTTSTRPFDKVRRLIGKVRRTGPVVSPESNTRLMPAAGGAVKTAPLALSTGFGGRSTSGTGTTSVIQYLHPFVSRAQLHLRNWNPRYTNADKSPAALTNVRIGRHTNNGHGTDWIDLPSGNTAYVSGWTEIPEALRGGEIVAQYTWSGPEIARTLGTAWEKSRTNSPALWAWIELEIPATVPVVAAFGSSTAAGVGADRPVIDSWLGQWTRAHHAVPALWAHSGDKALSWTANAHRKWELYGTGIAAPDAMLYAMGSNDWAEGIETTVLKQRITTTVLEIQQRITPNLYGTTITPRRTPPDNDGTRLEVNAWLSKSGHFQEVFDFAASVTQPDGSLDPTADKDGAHMNTSGHARLASAIGRSVLD